MNKPDWKDAPEWAQYLAMDANGEWYWYEREPSADDSVWWTRGRYEFASVYTTWQDTLEARPGANGPNDWPPRSTRPTRPRHRGGSPDTDCRDRRNLLTCANWRALFGEAHVLPTESHHCRRDTAGRADPRRPDLLASQQQRDYQE